MSFVLDWFLYQVPWWVWTVLALIILAVLFRLFGWKVTLAGGLAALAALAHIRGLQAGYRKKEDEQAAANRKAKITADRAAAKVDAMQEAEIREELAKWASTRR